MRTFTPKCFWEKNIIRHNLSLEIKSSINRKGVDLIICKQGKNCIFAFHDGTKQNKKFYPQIEQRLIREKNIDANGKYSQMVRTFKTVRNEMQQNEISSASDITSYTIECLLFNIKPRTYKKEYNTVTEKDNLIRFNAIINAVKARLSTYDIAKDFKEINQKNKLFQSKSHFNQLNKFWCDLKTYIKNTYNMGE